MKHLNLSVSGLVLLGFLSTSCANNPSSATGASGTTTVAAAATSTTTTSTTGPTVNQFSPQSGEYASMPTQVQVTFSETTMDPTSSINVANYSFSCNGQVYTASSVYQSNGVATVSLPYVNGLPSNSTCTLTLSSSIVDTSGNPLTGYTSVSYTVGTGSTITTTTTTGTNPTISEVSPASGSYATIPTEVVVTFSESTLLYSSVVNTNNWLLTCTSGTFYPNSVTYSGYTAVVYLPTTVTTMTTGSCNLTASTAISDSSGNTLLSGSAATYALTGTTTTTGTSTSTGIVIIHTLGGSSNCLDVLYDNLSSGTEVDSTGCNGTGAQDWIVTTTNSVATISPAANTSLCLDLRYNQLSQGVMQVATCNGTTAQQWQIGNGLIQYAANPSYCLDVHGDSSATSTPMDLVGCNGTMAQQFSLLLY